MVVFSLNVLLVVRCDDYFTPFVPVDLVPSTDTMSDAPAATRLSRCMAEIL